MPKVSLAFFTAAALCGLSGMLWGAHMGASGDHSLSPAHAHLNLVGWASLGLMGAFHALSGRAGKLAWVNFFLSATGAVLMAVLLALLLTEKIAGPMMMIAEVPVVAGMIVFAICVLRAWEKPKGA